MATADNSGSSTPRSADFWDKLRLRSVERHPAPVKNANKVHDDGLSPIDRIAIKITDKVGSVGFFLIILTWTICWTGYNILATEVPGLHWPSFDPFPAFVAYLLISNVIQILLMPLIMVGQNLQGRHTETRAELDFQINQKAEQEVTVILKHLEHNTDLIIQLMKHLDCKISPEELKVLQAQEKLAESIAARKVAVGDADA